MPAEKKEQILIVDDVSENRKILAAIISRNTDYEISLAVDGQWVLQSIEKNLPDLILLDIMMPGMNGYEVARILKEKSSTADIPIIFPYRCYGHGEQDKGTRFGGGHKR